MPIPGSLITADIQGASYYQEYLTKVAKHERYLVGETWSDSDSPTSKPTKIAKKPKPTAPKADLRPPVLKPASTKQPEPKSASAKTQGKKRKLTTEIFDKPSKDKQSRPGSVSKRRKPISSLRSVDESVVEDVPEKEPRVDDEEVDVKPESEKYQPLLEVPRKGKEKEIEEKVAHDLLTLQTPKKNSHVDRYIFQRRTSIPNGSSGHDESSSLYAELGLTDTEEESEEDVSGAYAGVQGQAGPDPGNAEASQPMPSPVVHAGSDREHMDLDVADVSTQPPPEQIDEGFTATAYPKVQENLKLTVKEQVILEEPASSSGTLSSLQHLTKDLSFGDLFFSDKPSKAENDKATAETEAKSMVSVTIQQDMSSIPPMTTPIFDLTLRPESPKGHQQLTATETATTTTITILPPPLEQRLDNHGARLYTLEQLDIPYQVSKAIDKVVTDAVDWAMQAPLRNRFRDLPEADMKEILHQRMWETDSYKTHEDHMQLYEALEKSMNRDHSEEIVKDLVEARKKKKKSRENAHIPKVNLRQDWWKPLEEERLATPEPAWSIPLSDVPVPTNNWASALASNYLPPPEDSLLVQTSDIAMFMDWHNVSKPLSLGGPPGQVTIQSDFFFNKDLEYLRFSSKGGRPALSILKIKAAYYPDAGLEQMVPDQMWIKEECNYDIVGMYGISHWWFQRQRFYIDKHTSECDRRSVRTHMRILSVVRIEVFSMYGYDYMKKIVLHRADLNEQIITERDFKYLYPSDFEDLYLLNLQEDFQLGIKSYQTQLNLTKPRWDATGFKYKHDYTHIDEALDYMVKEFKINRMNLGLNIRFWTRKDVDRSKEFLFAIQKWLKTRRIFRNLESFIGGRVRDGDYRLLKLDIEKVAVCSGLRSLKPKRTIESRAKRSSKIISLGHYSIMLASSHAVKSKTDIKSPTHYPCGIARTSESCVSIYSEDGNPARANI
nr:hypothetical protein [Tanacetum cinerariifolium]